MEKMKKDARRKERRPHEFHRTIMLLHDRSLPPHDHHNPVDNYESEVDDDDYENDEYDDEGMYSPEEPPPLEPDPQAYHHPRSYNTQDIIPRGITAGGGGT